MVPTIARCGCACHPGSDYPCVACEIDPDHIGPPNPPPVRDPRRVRAVARSRAYQERIRADVAALRASRVAP